MQKPDLLCKSMNCFLYDRDLRHERVKPISYHISHYMHHLEICYQHKLTTLFIKLIRHLISHSNFWYLKTTNET